MVPIKYLSSFWRTLEMPLINCEANVILTWSTDCAMIYTDVANQVPTFKITETNLYVQFKIMQNYYTIKIWFWRNNQLEWMSIKTRIVNTKSKLNHLVEPSFQGVNRLLVLALENDAQRTSSKRYYLLNVEIKDYNVMIDGKNFFDQLVKTSNVTYENIRKIATGQGDDYTTGCLLDYIYFKNYCKMIAVDLSKQQALDADPKAIQQINFTANLDRAENKRVYFILEEAKETVLDFSQWTANVF